MRKVLDKLVSVLGSRYAALLIMLLATLVLYSFLGSNRLFRWLFDMSVLALVASALRAISGNRGLYFAVMTLGIGSAVLGALGGSFAVAGVMPYGTVARAALLALVMVVIFRDVMTRKQVTMDAVLGACCIYLLMGLAWEAAYVWLTWLDPEAFVSAQGTIMAQSRLTGQHETDLLYFSLVTMTTIGYGDITPKSPPTRIAAAVEGLVAQLYLAIIIARMVGMELAHRERGSSPNP
jgi:hypothetical protein